MSEHEMKHEHGLELEKLKSEEKERLVEFAKGAFTGGRVYYLHREKKDVNPLSIIRLYRIVNDLNDRIKDWKGG